MPSKKIIRSGKRNHESYRYDLDRAMAMRPTAVATPAKGLNISLSGLDRAEELEQKSSRGTLLPFFASEHHSLPLLLVFLPSPRIYRRASRRKYMNAPYLQVLIKAQDRNIPPGAFVYFLLEVHLYIQGGGEKDQRKRRDK